MLKKISSLLLVLLVLSACTKKDNSDGTDGTMGINNDIPMTERDSTKINDLIALSLLDLFNSQVPMPEVFNGTVIFMAPNGDSFQLRRSVLTVRLADGTLYAHNQRMTRDLRGDSAEAEILYLENSRPEFLSSNGFDFMLSDGFVRLNWNAETLAWNFSIDANMITAADGDVNALKGYVLKDGFWMNTMQPLS